LVCGMEISVHAPCNPSPDKRYPGLCDQSYRSFLQHDLRRRDAEGLVEFSEKRKLNIRTNSTGVVIFIQRAQFLSFPNTEQHKDGLTSTSPARNGGEKPCMLVPGLRNIVVASHGRDDTRQTSLCQTTSSSTAARHFLGMHTYVGIFLLQERILSQVPIFCTILYSVTTSWRYLF
jgi:hypothetical protein